MIVFSPKQLQFLFLAVFCLFVTVCKSEDGSCATEVSQITDCSYLFQEEALKCVECLNTYLPENWPANDGACEYAELACIALAECPCSECGYTMLDYFNCACSSSITCTPTTTSPNAPSPVEAPVSPSKPVKKPVSPSKPVKKPVSPPQATAPQCHDESDALTECIGDENDATACANCFLGSLPNPIDSCKGIDDVICKAIEECPCGTCGDEILDLMNCGMPCSVTCPITNQSSEHTKMPIMEATAEPTALQRCLNESDALDECVVNELNATIECQTCFVNNLPVSMDSCADLDEGVCKAIEKCPCGTCGDKILDLMSCLEPCGVVTCPPDSEKPPTRKPNNPKPVKKPIVFPSPVYTPDAEYPTAEPTPFPCTDELVAFAACIGVDAYDACAGCIEGFLPTDADSCSDIDVEICLAIEQCTAFCGSCGDEVLDAFNCFGPCSITCKN